MAINKDNERKALHCAYTAGTGGGKSVAVQYSGHMPAAPCLAIFDPYGDYVYEKGNPKNRGFAGKRVYHYYDRKSFAKAFFNAWSTGLCFRIAYMPRKPSRDEMLWFCELMWHAADGNRRLDVVIEEVAKWCDTSSKEQSAFGECMTGGRKFGIVMHTIFQRATEVPKTVLSQSPYKIIGIQEARADAERMAKECDISLDEIAKLVPLTYIKKCPGWGNVEALDLRSVFD